LELRERGLWEQAFGSAEPTGNLCLIGGSLLVAGFLALNSSAFYTGWRVGKDRATEARQARSFLQMIKTEEVAFINATQSFSAQYTKADVDNALAAVNALEKRVASLQQETTAQGPLPGILTTYANAVRQWKNGLMILKETNPDRNQALKLLQLGDELRTEATQQFASRYSGKREPSRS